MEPKQIPEKPEKEKKQETTPAKQEPTVADAYWTWVRNNPMLTVNDVAAFGQEDGVIAVLTDKLGRPLSTASFFLPTSVVEKIASLAKKKG